MSRMSEVFDLIETERYRQFAKWGDQRHHNERWLTILVEEIGEVSETMLNHNEEIEILEEVVHVAAVAAAWLEDLIRKAEEMGYEVSGLRSGKA